VSVSPADFELYSRVTGTPLPRTPQEQMQLAPRVHQFIQNRGYQRPKGFLGEVGGYLKNAALLGGGLALVNYLSNNNDDSDDGIRVDLSSPGSVDASVVPQRLITGVKDVIGTQPSPAPTPTPQTPAPRENVGTVGSITRPLGVQVADPWGMDKETTEVVVPSRGFGPAPAPRAEAEGLRDIEFSMKPPIQRDPSFFNPTGSWGVGDTANLAGSAIKFAMDYGPTIAEQGALDIGKGIRDIQKGIDDTSVVINSVYDAGAATRQLLDSTIASLPTSSFQQSAPLEIGSQSILNDHPDVVQSGTGSDEVQNNRNYIAQGNVDLEGKPITVGEFDSAYPAEMYTDYRKFGVGGGGIKYLDAGNRYGGDPEMVGKVPSQRVKDEFISSAGIPQIDEELVGGEIAESAPPEAENFHILKQFVRGLTGQDSPVDYTTEPSRQDLLNEMNRRREGEMAQDGPNKAAYDAKQRIAEKTAGVRRVNSLAQDALDHYVESGAMSVRPQDSTSVKSFTVSPDMIFETVYGKTPDKRYGTDLSVRNTYSVDPSEVSEVANPDTFKEIERASWKEQAQRGEEVVDMMNEIAKTDKGAGFLANMISKDRDKKFIDAPREETY
tara:strand:- start:964 stop:2790 length:1827 start_codon:yes stop_codon:yes gene_type:complete